MTLALKRIAAPVEQPVSVAEARAHCRADSTDDALLAALIDTAAEQAEHILGRALVTQTWQIALDAFPAGAILLRMPPVQGIASVRYFNAAGDDTTLPPEAYVLDAESDLRTYLLPAEGTSWPATAAVPNAVLVSFVCGWPDAASVPAPIKAWMLLQIGALYRNREAFAVGTPVAELPVGFTDRLLDRYRVWEA